VISSQVYGETIFPARRLPRNSSNTNFRLLLLFIRNRPSFTERPYVRPYVPVHGRLEPYDTCLALGIRIVDVLPTRIGQYEYSTPASFYSYLRIRGLRAVILQQVRPIFFRTTGLLDNLTRWPTTYDHTRLFRLRKAYDPTGLRPYGPRPLQAYAPTVLYDPAILRAYDHRSNYSMPTILTTFLRPLRTVPLHRSYDTTALGSPTAVHRA